MQKLNALLLVNIFFMHNHMVSRITLAFGGVLFLKHCAIFICEPSLKLNPIIFIQEATFTFGFPLSQQL